jgi:hypothetical protein
MKGWLGEKALPVTSCLRWYKDSLQMLPPLRRSKKSNLHYREPRIFRYDSKDNLLVPNFLQFPHEGEHLQHQCYCRGGMCSLNVTELNFVTR